MQPTVGPTAKKASFFAIQQGVPTLGTDISPLGPE